MNWVVIIGYGVILFIGNDVDSFLNSLKEGMNGIVLIIKFDVLEIGIILVGEVKDFFYDKYFIKKDSKWMDMFLIYGIYVVLEVMEISGLDKEKMN